MLFCNVWKPVRVVFEERKTVRVISISSDALYLMLCLQTQISIFLAWLVLAFSLDWIYVYRVPLLQVPTNLRSWPGHLRWISFLHLSAYLQLAGKNSCVGGWLCKCNRVPWLSTKLELCSTSWNLVLSLLHLEGIISFFTHYIFYSMGLPRGKSNIWHCTFIYILLPL